jgi:DNA-binding transcriptional LysR family regulator
MGIYNLDINLLKTFVVVAEEKHFTKAAEKLFIEQSAVSKAIKRLETELGTTLFLRTNRRVELTSKGQSLYLRASEIIGMTHEFINYAKDLDKDVSGTLKFGAESPISFLYIPTILSKLAHQYPKLWPMMFTETTSSLAERVKSREIEFALVFYDGDRIRDLEYKEIKDVEFQLVISPKARIEASNSFIGSREINNKIPKLPTFEKLRRLNKNIKIKYSTNDIMAYKEFVLSGLGIGLLPKEFVQDDLRKKRLKLVYPKFKLTFPIYLIYHRSYPLSLEAKKLIELIKTI